MISKSPRFRPNSVKIFRFPLLRFFYPCFIMLKSSLMKWCSVVFRVENCVHQFLHLVLRSFLNYQTFLCIIYHVSSDLFTLWNAYTSYESSSSYSRTQFCEHFKDPTINTLKSKPSLFVKLLGYAILWEVSLGKGNIWSVTVFAPPTVQSLRGLGVGDVQIS